MFLFLFCADCPEWHFDLGIKDSIVKTWLRNSFSTALYYSVKRLFNIFNLTLMQGKTVLDHKKLGQSSASLSKQNEDKIGGSRSPSNRIRKVYLLITSDVENNHCLNAR